MAVFFAAVVFPAVADDAQPRKWEKAGVLSGLDEAEKSGKNKSMRADVIQEEMKKDAENKRQPRDPNSYGALGGLNSASADIEEQKKKEQSFLAKSPADCATDQQFVPQVGRTAARCADKCPDGVKNCQPGTKGAPAVASAAVQPQTAQGQKQQEAAASAAQPDALEAELRKNSQCMESNGRFHCCQLRNPEKFDNIKSKIIFYGEGNGAGCDNKDGKPANCSGLFCEDSHLGKGFYKVCQKNGSWGPAKGTSSYNTCEKEGPAAITNEAAKATETPEQKADADFLRELKAIVAAAKGSPQCVEQKKSDRSGRQTFHCCGDVKNVKAVEGNDGRPVSVKTYKHGFNFKEDCTKDGEANWCMDGQYWSGCLKGSNVNDAKKNMAGGGLDKTRTEESGNPDPEKCIEADGKYHCCHSDVVSAESPQTQIYEFYKPREDFKCPDETQQLCLPGGWSKCPEVKADDEAVPQVAESKTADDKVNEWAQLAVEIFVDESNEIIKEMEDAAEEDKPALWKKYLELRAKFLEEAKELGVDVSKIPANPSV
ncbi:MAG: hypothetical protein LBH81_00515 [Rickettsiales bacterium]|nr:hypothetical protein [Rickettsiales bacterium]